MCFSTCPTWGFLVCIPNSSIGRANCVALRVSLDRSGVPGPVLCPWQILVEAKLRSFGCANAAPQSHILFLLLTCIVAAGAEYAGKLVTGQGLVTKYKPSSKAFASKFNEQVLPTVADFNTKLEARINNIVFAHDIEATLKAAGLSYILYKLTSWFSLYTLLLTSVILTFTVPAGYQANKKEIDAAVHKYSACARARATNLTKQAQTAAAPHLDNLAKKTGPVGDFIAARIPTRTAGSTVGSSPSGYDGASTSSTAYEHTIRDTPHATTVPTVGAGAFRDDATSATTTGLSQFPDVPSTLKHDIAATAEALETTANTGASKGDIPVPTL